MKFTRVFRGYDPKQVNKYVEELENKESQLRAAQKQRIDELADENYALRKQVEQYKTDEQAISKALVDSQKLATELQNNAEKLSDLTLSRAKIFYATWHTYAETLIATLSDEEVRSFNRLKEKIEKIIDAYDGKSVRQFATEVAADVRGVEYSGSAAAVQAKPIEKQPDVAVIVEAKNQPVAPEKRQSAAPSEETRNSLPSEKTMGIFANPVTKVEQAAHVIDLRELVMPTDSLEDLCRDLGLKKDS